MSLKTECKNAIYHYADEEAQRNAALTGEHIEYVNLVLTLFRDSYREQNLAGATTFTIDPLIASLLEEECPWID